MIIESIRLKHVGRFLHPVTAGPLTGGLNVLAALNEAGKTTLVKAAARALFDRHTCKDSEIKTLQPAGTDLAPNIQIVFQAAAGKFRIEKSFLLSPKCLLSQWKNGDWQPVAEGDAADLRMQGLLKSKPPGRGASHPAHWGLLRYLWARQGEPAVWPDWDGDAGELIQSRLAKVEIDHFIDRVRAALWDDYSHIFTATGQARTGGPLKKAEEALSQLEDALRAGQQRRQELEKLQIDYQARAGQLAALEQESDDAQKNAVQIREAAAQSEVNLAELQSRRLELETAQAVLRAITEDAERIETGRRELAEASRLLEEAQIAVTQSQQAEHDTDARRAQADLVLEEHQRSVARIQSELERVRGLLKLRQARTAGEEATALLNRVAKHSAALKCLLEQRAKVPRVTVEQCRSLEARERGLREKTIRIESLGLTVELIAEQPAEVEISEEGSRRALHLEPGTSEIIKRPQSVDLRLAGWGTVRVRSGATEIKTLVAELQSERRELDEALLDLGVKTCDEARTALASRQETDQEIRSAEAGLEGLLGEWKSEDRLQQATRDRQARLEAMAGSLTPTTLELRLTQADLEAQERNAEVQCGAHEETTKRLLADAKMIAGEVTAATGNRQQAEKQAIELKARVHGLEEQIRLLSARYAQGLGPARQAAQQAFVEAEARSQAAQRKLPPDFERLPERNRHAAATAAQITAEWQRKKTELAQIEGQLKARGSEGLYSKETALLEQKEAASHAARGARSRGWAMRLVHDLIEYRKQAATRSVLAPLEARLSTVFAEITGDYQRRVFLDETLQVRGVGRNPSELIAFDSMSQGAREQLLLALRLAVATELAANEPQLLILDDVLVNTDAPRQGRILEQLRSAAEGLQILILTCHPERYRGVGHHLEIQSD